MIVLTLYSRPDCHLCATMLEELEPLVAGRARIEVVDISEDDSLSERYGLKIPVLTHGDDELSRYRLNRERLRAFFDHPSP
jgi:thioredoxin reductase (NADPH)